jgi:hypothetical protein
MRAPRAARRRAAAPLLLAALLALAAPWRAAADTSSDQSSDNNQAYDSAPVHSAAAGAAYVTGCMAQVRATCAAAASATPARAACAAPGFGALTATPALTPLRAPRRAQYTAQPLTPQCVGSYADLQQLVLMLLTQPQLLGAADLSVLQGFCQQTSYSTCLNQLNSQVVAFLQHAAAPTKTACDVALGPNVPALLQLLSNFLCLVSGRGESCPQVLAIALQDLGLLDMATGRAPFVAKDVFQPTTCAVLNASGCCGAAFLEVAYAASQMACHSEQASAAQMLASQCTGIVPPCPAFAVPAYESVADCRGAELPKTCSTPEGSCPDSPCELLCAIVTNEPPSEPAALSAAAQIAVVANSTRDVSPVAAATYLTTCLEIGAGQPLPPQCATTYADLETLIPLALNAPSTNIFGAGDAAILSGLCAEGSDGQMSCMQLQLEALLAWVGAMPQPASTVCDAVLGPNVPGLAIYATYFACLSNAEEQMCLPAIGGALAAAGLGPTLRSGAPLNIADVDPSTFCPALGATGCCAGAFIQVLQAYYSMTCQSSAAAQLTGLLAACDGVPDACANFQLPEITPPASCPAQITGPPQECAFTAGECPQTPCELLCAVATLQRPAPVPAALAAVAAVPVATKVEPKLGLDLI